MTLKKEEAQIVKAEVTPMTLIESAQQKGASIEQMSQLFELQLRWEENEAKKAYNEAISAFRAECPSVKKSKSGYDERYRFEDLATDIINTVKPIMSKHGLSHRWNTKQEGSKITVMCTVSHVLGHSESTELSAEPDTSGSKNSIQAIGSTVTYLERYTLKAILGLASTDQDDDGAAAEPISYISEQEQADLQALMDEVKISEERLLKRMQVPSLDKIPADKCQLAIRLLESKRGGK